MASFNNRLTDGMITEKIKRGSSSRLEPHCVAEHVQHALRGTICETHELRLQRAMAMKAQSPKTRLLLLSQGLAYTTVAVVHHVTALVLLELGFHWPRNCPKLSQLPAASGTWLKMLPGTKASAARCQDPRATVEQDDLGHGRGRHVGRKRWVPHLGTVSKSARSHARTRWRLEAVTETVRATMDRKVGLYGDANNGV